MDEKKPVNHSDVIKRLCRLQAEVFQVIGDSHSADCFCGEGGFWGSGKYDGSAENGYRNDLHCIEFIERVTREAIEEIRSQRRRTHIRHESTGLIDATRISNHPGARR